MYRYLQVMALTKEERHLLDHPVAGGHGAEAYEPLIAEGLLVKFILLMRPFRPNVNSIRQKLNKTTKLVKVHCDDLPKLISKMSVDEQLAIKPTGGGSGNGIDIVLITKGKHKNVVRQIDYIEIKMTSKDTKLQPGHARAIISKMNSCQNKLEEKLKEAGLKIKKTVKAIMTNRPYSLATEKTFNDMKIKIREKEDLWKIWSPRIKKYIKQSPSNEWLNHNNI